MFIFTVMLIGLIIPGVNKVLKLGGKLPSLTRLNLFVIGVNNSTLIGLIPITIFSNKQG